MKPGFTPYHRNSRLGLQMLTVNPCNQFIIQALLRWKIKMQKNGLNQFFTYNLTVQAVRKYPMPILCWEQMKAMEGFGKFMCVAVGQLIRSHYNRGRMPTQQQKDQDDKDHQNLMKRQMKKFKKMMKKNGKAPEQMQGLDGLSQIDQDNQSEYSEFNDNFQSQFHDQQSQQPYDDDDNQSSCSQNSQSSNRSNKSYKPKPGSDNFNFFRAINAVLAKKKEPNGVINKGDLNIQLYDWKMDKIKNWQKLSFRLQESGYIKIDPKDQDLFVMTTKGKDFLMQVQQSEKTKLNQNTNIVIFRKQILQQATDPQKLTILINTRGSYKPEDAFTNILYETHKSKTKQIQFELASFLWMLDEKLLDYIVFRIKVQNYEQEQFLQNCIRARNSTCNNIFFVLQYPADKSRKIMTSKQDIQNLKAKCRASGFKIVEAYGGQQTIKFLQQITKKLYFLIQKVAQKTNPILLLGRLQVYNEKNRKLLPSSLKQIMRKMLRCLPKTNRDVIQVLLQKLPTFYIAHEYMLQLNNSQERVRFMAWALNTIKFRYGTLQMLDDLLYRDNYQLEDQDNEMNGEGNIPGNSTNNSTEMKKDAQNASSTGAGTRSNRSKRIIDDDDMD